MTRLPAPLVPMGRTRVQWQGRCLTYFGGCDYFRLASRPATLRAAQQAARRYGLSFSASRMTTGNSPLLVELETALAEFLEAPKALVTSTGSSANACLGEALGGEFTHALIDERSHPSIRLAVSSLGARVLVFPHRDPESVRARLTRLPHGSRVILATDGVFPLDGAIAPLARYRALLPPSAWLWVDDCHGIGTVGTHGAGSTQLEGISHRNLVRTATLSKALGSFGGIILGNSTRVDQVLARSATFASGTPPPPPSIAAALENLRHLSAQPALRARLESRVAETRAALRRAGVDLIDSPAPILGIVPTSNAQQRRILRRLLSEQIHPPFIRYPGGPRNGLFRFALSSEHSQAQVRALVRALSVN